MNVILTPASHLDLLVVVINRHLHLCLRNLSTH